ncbi:MAG: hypothetical protein ISS72_09385 [Candidatus Brocadiae bacterium]|nr:hypothetical protein [Candidatus Brocadiia bacterium]
MIREERPRRIDEEVVCVDSLVHCVKQRHGCVEASVERAASDPPDFWIYIDGVRFAVEVTSVVRRADVESQALLRRLDKDIEQQAREQGVLRGTYGLWMSRPMRLPRRHSAEWRSLVQIATQFIRATQHLAPAGPVLLLEGKRSSLTIEKHSEQGEAVGHVGPVVTRWEGEAREEIRGLMQSGVDHKRRRLEAKGVHRECPRIILAFYDAYGLGDVEDAQQALLQVEGYQWFDSVFWAASFTDRPNDVCPNEPGREGRFLYSQNPQWCTNPPQG